MSRTKRKDSSDVARKCPDFIFMGEVCNVKPTEKEKQKAHADKKKSYKPSRAAKEYLTKGAKAKTKRALEAVVENPDEAPLPVTKQSHVWDYN